MTLTEKIKSYIKESSNKSKYVDKWFFSQHLEVVYRFAKQLLIKFPAANREIVELAVWLHDTQRIFNIDGEHDLAGAKKSTEILHEFGVSDEKLLANVYEAIKTHQATNYPPLTIESKILATADALSHFSCNFYLEVYLSKMKKNEFGSVDSFKEWALAKINRDYNDKISFDEARGIIAKEYQLLINFFSHD